MPSSYERGGRKFHDRSTNKNKRTPGTITAQLSPVNFRVEISPGKFWKRHVDQILKYKEDDNSGAENPNPEEA
ncbi:hypothetical protein TKK_0017621 [Trichogramma kaykai]